ncbi:hypothetical protein Tco_1162250 [Tanacetum coccineum]
MVRLYNPSQHSCQTTETNTLRGRRWGDVGSGEEVREMVLLLWLPDGEGRRRVEESEVSGWIDRLTRSILGVAGKIPPEKFSGGCGGGRRWWGFTGEESGRESE